LEQETWRRYCDNDCRRHHSSIVTHHIESIARSTDFSLDAATPEDVQTLLCYIYSMLAGRVTDENQYIHEIGDSSFFYLGTGRRKREIN
jgi:hypothetical protein